MSATRTSHRDQWNRRARADHRAESERDEQTNMQVRHACSLASRNEISMKLDRVPEILPSLRTESRSTIAALTPQLKSPDFVNPASAMPSRRETLGAWAFRRS